MLCLGDFVPCDAGLMNSAVLDALDSSFFFFLAWASNAIRTSTANILIIFHCNLQKHSILMKNINQIEQMDETFFVVGFHYLPVPG